MRQFEKLTRYPPKHDKNLKAWDASDELVLAEFETYSESIDVSRVLILNDSFGALKKAFINYHLTVYSDSYISQKAGKINNPNGTFICVNDLNDIEGTFDLVILKVPKNMSFMEDMLIHISKHLRPTSKLICSGMTKYLPKSAFDLINKYIGPTTTSLARKKARLIYAKPNYLKKIDSPYPIKINIPEWEFPIINHSNVFSREKLDIGTRFFLDHIPSGSFDSILDLGCGNGIIGLKAKKLNPRAHIIYADDSMMALKSAKANLKTAFPKDEATYFWTNCYEEENFPKVDLVLCNPPFHQGNTVGDFIARQMFKDSFDALQKDGKIIVIGNRHLGYHVRLKKLFGNVNIVNQNKKFVILEALKL